MPTKMNQNKEEKKREINEMHTVTKTVIEILTVLTDCSVEFVQLAECKHIPKQSQYGQAQNSYIF